VHVVYVRTGTSLSLSHIGPCFKRHQHSFAEGGSHVTLSPWWHKPSEGQEFPKNINPIPVFEPRIFTRTGSSIIKVRRATYLTVAGGDGEEDLQVGFCATTQAEQPPDRTGS
jgi:hypothetical protein